MNNKNIIFLFCFFLIRFSAFSNNIDSLKNILPTLNRNEKKVALKKLIPLLPENEKPFYYNELVDIIVKSNPGDAFDYSKKVIVLSKKYSDKIDLARAYVNLAWLYFSPKLMYDSSEYFALQSINLVKNDTAYNIMGDAYNIAGISQADQGKLDKGLKYFEKAEEYYFKAKNFCRAATIHHNIGKLNKYSKGNEEVKKYFLESLEMFKKFNCEEKYDYLYSNLGEIYISENEYDKAKEMFHKVLEIANKYNLVESKGIAYFSLGELYMHIDTTVARHYYEKTLKLADSVYIVKLQIAANLDLGKYYLTLKKLNKAKHYIDLALEKSVKAHKLFYIQLSHRYLSDYYQKIKNYKKALYHFKKKVAYEDSIGAEKVKMQIMSLENDKKENQIKLLNQENVIIELKERRSRIFAYLIFLIMILGLIISLFLFRNYKNKQEMKKMEVERIAQNKILKMERKLLTSVIVTEDKERKRFAADLHDGLGPLLSSIKLFLDGVLYSEEKERKELIIETKGIVDQAINDIRNISRNIMPESFSEHGLLQTLLSFIERIKVSKVLNIEFKHNLIGISYNKAFEIIVYRIITELINNTLKHANANNVIIKVFENDNVLNIFYKDDGRGFNVNSVVNSDKSGLGLKNILERVKSLGGEINISSNWKIGIIVEILLNVK